MAVTHRLTVSEVDTSMRLDKYLSREIDHLTRSYIQKLLTNGCVLVNGCKVKASYKVQLGDEVILEQPVPEEKIVEPEPIPLDICYEDEHVIVVNKRRGMVVHPLEDNLTGTLVNALLYHYRDLSSINGKMRPGIVHRIDKDTTGLLVVAKNDNAHLNIVQQLKDHTVTRRYLALVMGNLEMNYGTINAPIGRDPRDRRRMTVIAQNSKPATTHFRVKKRFHHYTLVKCRLETGRTHQIRVHMAYLKHPVVGDAKYGGKDKHINVSGQLLHAAELGFKHPHTGKFMKFEASLPNDFNKIVTALANESN